MRGTRQQVLACVVLATWVGAVWSQTKEASEPPLLFRRELLPQSLLSRNAAGLTPIKRTEFETLLKAANSRANAGAPQVWIESAEYEATVQDNRLVGKSRLRIHTRSTEPALLHLAGLQLPVSRPMWEGSPRAAIVGATPEGDLYAVVEQSGVLAFEWTLSGSRDPWQAVVFDVHLAESSQNALALSLPAEWRLESSQGLVSRPASDSERWELQLGAARDARLRCAPPNAEGGPVVLVREENAYSVSLGEVEIQCQLRLDVYRQPVRQLEVELLGQWRPTMIRLGDYRVPFELHDESAPTATLHFDPPLSGTNRRLVFTGKDSIDEGQHVMMPRVRLRNAAWLEGSATIHSNKVQLINWQWTGVQRTLTSTMSGTSTSWNLVNEDAAIAFQVDRLPANLRADLGATVRADAESATARIVTDFSAESAGVFELEGEVAAAWIIDSVETVPPQIIDDWEVSPSGSRQELRITLNRSVAPNQGVRVVVQAHRPPPAPQENLSIEYFRPVRWLARHTKGFLALGIDARWQTEFRGSDRVRRVDAGTLTAAESDRLQLSEDVMLLVDDDALDNARLVLAEESAPYVATWQIRVEAEKDQLRQGSQLRVEPAGSPIEQVRVLVRPSAGKELEWRVQGDDASAIEARLVRTSDGPASEDEWELTLRRARRNPFVINAELIAKPTTRFPVRLFRCLEATSQSAVVELARGTSTRLVVEQVTEMERLWNVDGEEGELARWTYDPSQSASLMLRAATTGELAQLLWVDRLSLETRLADDQLIQEARFYVANQQARTLSIHLPPGSEVDHVHVQDKRVDVRSSASDQTLLIPLPKSSAIQEIRLVFRTPAQSYGAVTAIEPLWPECDVAPASRSWQVIFPEQYRHVSWRTSGRDWSLFGLWERLRGPLPGFGFSTPSDVDQASQVMGCRQIEFDDRRGIPSRVRLIHEDALAAIGWAALVLSFTCVVANRRATRRELSWLLGLLGMVALSLPAILDPVGRMTLLGALAGLIGRQWLTQPTARRNIVTANETGSLSLAVHGILIIVALVLAADVHAQPPAEKDVVHRVVFPVDDGGKPAGDYVYMSDRFFRELVARSQKPVHAGPSALLRSAHYRAKPHMDALSWESVEATIELEILHAPAIVTIPWSRAGFLVPAERIRLDGDAILASWDADGAQLSLTVDTPGHHTMEMTGQPTTRDDKSRQRCELRLPPVASATLSLDSLRGGADVQVLPHWVAPQIPDEDGVEQFELGRRRELTLVTRPRESDERETNAEQLLWANLWTAGGVVEARWRFTSANGPLEAASVDVEGDFELLSAAALSPASVKWNEGEGKSTITWSPREPAEELVVEAMFLWRGGGASDRVLPRIEPRASTVSRRWLGIDLAPNAALAIAPSSAAETIDVQEFATLWNAEEPPKGARRLAQAGPALIATPIKEGIINYQGVTRCDITQRAVRWEFRADLVDVETPRSLLRLAIPGNAKLVSAELGVAGQYRSVPWLSLGEGQVALLPPEPLRSGSSLVVRGDQSVLDGKIAFDFPAIDQASMVSHDLQLWRQSDVQVEVSNLGNLLSVPLASQPNSAQLIPVAHVRIDESTPAADRRIQWSIQPNQPRTVGILVTTLRQKNQRWLARLDAFLAVRDGTVDDFRFELPATWSALKLVEGSATLETSEESGNVRQVHIRPLGGTNNRWHVAWEGILADSGPNRAQAPVVRLLDAEAVQQYLRLPLGAEYHWSTSGVQDSSLPPAITVPDDGAYAVYRVAVPQFLVELVAAGKAATQSPHGWSDVLVVPRQDGSYLGIAHLAVDPAGEIYLPITLPPESLLMRADVEGEAVVVELKGKRRVDVPLRSSTLPQIVSVLYTGTLPKAKKYDLNDLSIGIERWKLNRPTSVRSSENVPAYAPPLSQITQLLAPVMANPVSLETAHPQWARIWLQRINEAPARLGENQSEAEVSGAEIEQATQIVDVLQSIAGEAAPVSERSGRTFFLGQAAPLPATSGNVAMTTIGWLLALLGWAGIVVAGNRLTRSSVLAEMVRRWPSCAAVMIGLLVALFVSPVWIGGVLMVIGAASSLAWPWRSSSPPMR